uniref:Uncharacterized protein n=1 Tax=Cacopsylla melanoneura TaxID=428564 RepID=A0A8D8TPN3_9HEMI
MVLPHLVAGQMSDHVLGGDARAEENVFVPRAVAHSLLESRFGRVGFCLDEECNAAHEESGGDEGVGEERHVDLYCTDECLVQSIQARTSPSSHTLLFERHTFTIQLNVFRGKLLIL